MTKLSAHQSGEYVKMLYAGDSGVGKTGSLVSLVKAGYSLKILDFDNGLDPLKAFINKECPDKINNVDFETLRDPVKGGDKGPITTARAHVEATKLMSKWSDGSDPAEGGPMSVFVIDSSTGMGASALNWATAMAPNAKDPRNWYWAGQRSVEHLIQMATSKDFHSNFILICHLKEPDADEYKDVKGPDGKSSQVLVRTGTGLRWPTAVGSALGPLMPTYFNTFVEAAKIGTGRNVKRIIRTVATPEINLKNPAPFRVEAELDLGTGLAELFAKLKAA